MADGTTATQQEGFVIHNDEAVPRKKIVRQDRIYLEPKKCFIELEKQKYEVLNVSPFGLAITLNGIMLNNLKNGDRNEFIEVPIIYSSTQVQLLHLKLARSEKIIESAHDDYVLGFEILGEPLSVDIISALEKTSDVILSQNEHFTKLTKIPSDFKNLVFEMRDWLQKLKSKIDFLEKAGPQDNADELAVYKKVIAETIGEYLGKVIPSRYLTIPKMLDKTTKEEREYCIKFIREQIGDLVYGAPFANRAYNKPRGYAGDYEMMNHLYRNEPVGMTLYDQCMHRYFIDEPAGQAVKNRGIYLLNKIKEVVGSSRSDKIKILSIASGPAMEVQLFVREFAKEYKKNVEFTLIDQDDESLKHAQKQLSTIERFAKTGVKFRFINLAIKNIIAKGLPDSDFDLIYSAGLFDYFTDPVAQAAASKMIEATKKEGISIIGNFSKSNPCVPFMELVLDWHLIYRSAEDMERIFSVIRNDVKIEQEPLGVNLFAVLRK